MATTPINDRIPIWDTDHLASTEVPQAGEPYFDTKLSAWVLSRYSDVAAALSSPNLAAVGLKRDRKHTDEDEIARLKVRAETQAAISTEKLRLWEKETQRAANARVLVLTTDRPVDLLEEYAAPVCLILAALATNPDPYDAQRLSKLAEVVSDSAAEPFDVERKAKAKIANAELRPCFHSGPETLRDSGFVALSHTIVRLLGNMWFSLLQHPQQWSLLHREPSLVPRAVEELLRYAGFPRVLFRRAQVDTTLGNTQISAGDYLVLRIIAANRDPLRFADPNELDVTRRDVTQLMLGAGMHACVGAPLIRLAAVATTLSLVERFESVELAKTVEWRGGSGFVFPYSLRVHLR